MFAIQDPQNFYVKAQPIDAWGQLPVLASKFSAVDGLFYFTLVICIFFFLLITAILGYSVVKYRRRTIDQAAASNVTHNTPLEVIWTVIPLIIVMIIFAWGWKGSLDMTVVPADARQYKALAQQWRWTFFYPNDPAPSVGELWLEVDKPAAFTLESTDVLHAFYMPAMRVKRDVVPGQYHTIWFHPTRLGDFHLFCAEYCGNDHSLMYAKVHVVTAATYATRPWDQWDPKDPVGNGKKVWMQNCKACHSIDGTPVVGPTFKGLWGKKETVLVKGKEMQVDVDEAYVIESIRDPEAKKVKGFENQNMTPFKADVLKDDTHIKWVIEYLKTLAAK